MRVRFAWRAATAWPPSIAFEARAIARIAPVESDRRARRLARGALRPASEHGVPVISSPIRDSSTEQMIEDMRGDRS